MSRLPALNALHSPDSSAAHAFIDELVRKIVIHEMRPRRDSIRHRVGRGELPALPDLSDEQMGVEAVRLVKESRRHRATSRA